MREIAGMQPAAYRTGCVSGPGAKVWAMSTAELPVDFSPLDSATEPTIVDLPIAGAWLFAPRVFGDARGSFHEGFRAAQFTEHLGYPFDVAQANVSRSSRDVVRGIHLAEVPPGQAKFVSCLAGEVVDVLVDLRVGSPTFGKHIKVTLSESNNYAVHVPIGVGHGFVARSETAVLNYLVTEAYNPDREFGVDPFDPELGIDWGVDRADAVLSDKDAAAPALAEVHARLADWQEARGWEQQLRREWSEALDFADSYGEHGEG